MAKNKVLIIDAVLALAAISAAIVARAVLTVIDMPECFFYTTSGIPCMMCGGTRCVYNFVQFKFYDAFTFNPYVFMIIIYLIILFLVFNIRYLTDNSIAKKVYKIMCDYRSIIVLVVLCPVFWIVRVASII